MECPKCGQEYDHKERMPRIMIRCGHSVCESCIRAIIERNDQQCCPECDCVLGINEMELIKMNKVDGIVEKFPKNLALLKKSGWNEECSPEVRPRLQKFSIHGSYMRNHMMNGELQETGDCCHNFCEIHPSKAVEAFCVEDRCLLCLECIVSNNHKGHEISSLLHGYSIQKQELESLKEILKSRQNKIEVNYFNCQKQHSQLVESEKECKSDIDDLFKRVITELEKIKSKELELKDSEFSQGKDKLQLLMNSYKSILSSSKHIEMIIENMLKFSHIEFLKIFKQKEISNKLESIVCLPYEAVTISEIDQSKIIKSVVCELNLLFSDDDNKNNDIINYLSVTSSHPSKGNTRTRENPLKQNFSASTCKAKSKCTNISIVGKDKKGSFITTTQNFASPGKSCRKSIKTNKSSATNRPNNHHGEDNIYGGVVASTHYKFKNDTKNKTEINEKIAKAQVQLFNSSERINLKDANGFGMEPSNPYSLETKVDQVNEYMKRRSTIASSKNNYYGFDVIPSSDEVKIIEETEIVKINEDSINLIKDSYQNMDTKTKIELDLSSGSQISNKENSLNKANKKNFKSASFINIKRPTLQEVRNKAKEEKLRNKQKLCSLERIPDDSEIIEEDENHIHIQNKKYTSKGKTLKTINSINRECKDKKIYIEETRQYNRSSCNKKIAKCLKNSSRINENTKIPKTCEVDQFYDVNIAKNHCRGGSKFESFKDNEVGIKSSKRGIHDRNFSNSRIHDRCKSNVNHNRHFQIKNDCNQLNSLTAYLKLINNFPDMRCASTDNLKCVDPDNINKNEELTICNKSTDKFKHSLIKTCKSSREQREILNFENRFCITDECDTEPNQQLVCKETTSILKSGNSRNKNSGVKCNESSKNSCSIKITGCLLNKVLPFKRISQLPDTPSIEFDINDYVDEDEVQISVRNFFYKKHL